MNTDINFPVSVPFCMSVRSGAGNVASYGHIELSSPTTGFFVSHYSWRKYAASKDVLRQALEDVMKTEW